MNTSKNEIATEMLLCQRSKEWMEEELHNLEDAYAECLADNVDAQTLSNLWLRIKAIKRELSSTAKTF
jgi:hypothetical protein